jgi:homoserine O-succinyltransferase
MMTGDGLPRRLSDVTPRNKADLLLRGKAPGSLTIAVINNMPDAALQATERQFCTLLDAASTGMLVHLKFYSLPGVGRSEIAKAHIDTFYEDLCSLAHDPPDGLIMTGAEPHAACLKDEAFWLPMADVINYCHDAGVPGIWSCLAAHAAVLEIDGIPRVRLPQKLFGTFECRIARAKHQLFHRMPDRWFVPHSRFNTLRSVDLERNGYDIVSASSKTGADIFIKRYHCLQVFLQGHPEYDLTSLGGEFRRDILRAFTGQRPSIPDLPTNLKPRFRHLMTRKLQSAVTQGNEVEMQACLETILSHVQPDQPWVLHTRKLFENWLTYVDARKRRQRETQAVFV